MNILIVIKSFDRINLFLNLAYYLDRQDCSVDFLTPKLHIKQKVKSHNFLVFSKIPKNKTYDKVLFWNGANTPEKKYFESLPETDCWYFENGYWQGATIQLNRKGVNAEADYAKLLSREILHFTYSEQSLPQVDFTTIEKQNISYMWYFLDRCRMLFTGDLKTLFESLSNIYRGKRATLRFANTNTQEQPSGAFVFFPLQVNSDTQLVYNSPYDSIVQVIRLLQQNMVTNRKIVIKTHPKEFEKYTIPTDHRTEICHKINLDQAVLDSDFVVTINSSVGFQALEKHKKVLHLGDSFYENFPGVVKCNLLEDNLQEVVRRLEKMEVDWGRVDELMYHFRKNIFIEGNWQNVNSNVVNKICQRILGAFSRGAEER